MSNNQLPISLHQLPDTIKSDVTLVQNAEQVSKLSSFIEHQISISLNHQISNTFPFYDIVSRFLRNKKGHVAVAANKTKVIETREISEKIEGIEYKGTLKLKPAVIEVDGVEYFAWPSDREAKVERALMRLASKGNIKKFSGKRAGYAIIFSIRELAKELASVNQTMSGSQIKEALIVLKESVMSFDVNTKSREGSERNLEFSVTYINGIFFNGEKGKSRVKCVAFLNEFMTEQIESISYRSYYFDRTQNLSRSLSRWLSFRLYQLFRYASLNKTYNFNLISTLNKYGTDTKESRLPAMRRDMTTTIKELVEAEIIESYTIRNIKDEVTNEIINYTYEIKPTARFCDEILSLNKYNKYIASKSADLKGETLL